MSPRHLPHAHPTSPEARAVNAERKAILAAFVAPLESIDIAAAVRAWNAKHTPCRPGWIIESKLTGRRQWYATSPTGAR